MSKKRRFNLCFWLPTLFVLLSASPALAEDEIPMPICIVDEGGTTASYSPELNTYEGVVPEHLAPSSLAGECRTDISKAPKGSCWQACFCVCRTENGNDPVTCFVQIQSGQTPSLSRCPGAVDCKTQKGTGHIAACRLTR